MPQIDPPDKLTEANATNTIHSSEEKVANANINEITKQWEATKKLIDIQKEQVKEAKAQGQATEDLEKTLKDLEDTLVSLSKEYKEQISVLKSHERGQKDMSTQLLIAAAVVEGAVYKFQRYSNALADAAAANAEYVKGLKEQLRYAQLSEAFYDTSTLKLEQLRRNLKLTRDEFITFLNTYKQSASMGIDIATVEKLGAKLREVRGHAEALKSLESLTSGNIDGNSLRGLVDGDVRARARISGMSSRDQRKAVMDYADTSKVNDGNYENFKRWGTEALDNLKDSFSQVLDKMTGGLGKYLGTGSAIVAQMVAQVFASGVQMKIGWESLSQLRQQTNFLSILSMSSKTNMVNSAPGFMQTAVGSKWGGRLARIPARAGGVGALLGLAGSLSGEYMKSGSDPGSAAHRTGAGLSALGGIGGMAATGATLGAIFGPVGAAIGGVAGAAIGLYTNFDDLKESLQGVGNATDQLMRKEERMRKSLNLEALDQTKDDMIARYKVLGDEIENSFEKELMDLSALRQKYSAYLSQNSGQNIISGLQGKTTMGTSRFLDTAGSDVSRIRGQMQALRNDRANMSGDEFNEKMDILKEQMTSISINLLQMVEAMDWTKYTDMIDKSSEMAIRGVKLEAERTAVRAEMYAKMAGSQKMVEMAYEASKTALAAEISEIDIRIREREKIAQREKQYLEGMIQGKPLEESQRKVLEERLSTVTKANASIRDELTQRLQSNDLSKQERQALQQQLKTQDEAYMQQRELIETRLRNGALDTEQRNLLRERLSASEQELEFQREQLAAEKEKLQNQRAMKAIAEIQSSVNRTQGTSQYRLIQERGNLGQANLDAVGAIGANPAQIAAAYKEIVNSQKESLNLLKSEAKADMEFAKRRVAELEEIAKASGNEEDKRHALLAAQEYQIAATQKEIQIKQAETQVRRSMIQAITAEMEKARGTIDTRKELLTVEKEFQEYIGASYPQIYNLQSKILQEQVNGYNEIKKAMEKMKADAAAAQINLAELPDYQKLQVQLAREASEIAKASMARQRDFMEQALGKMFGVATGSKFNPVIADRQIFGEHMKTQSGQMVGVGRGTPMTLAERSKGFAAITSGAKGGPAGRLPVSGPTQTGAPPAANNVVTTSNMMLSGDVNIRVQADKGYLIEVINQQFKVLNSRGGT